MKALRVVVTAALMGLLLAIGSAVAQPAMINYQGRLAHDTGWPVTDNVSIVFCIYDQATGGVPIWTETHSSVDVRSGIYNVLLGSVNQIPDDIFDESDLWLGIKINDDSEMSPRQRIASVGYAINSDMVDGLHASYFGDAHSLDAADGSPTDAVYVDDAGRMGIGVTNPIGTLHLKANSTLYMGAGGFGSSTIWLGGPHHNSVPYARFETAGDDGAGNARLEIKTFGDTTPTMTLKQGGKVGIGTKSPETKLDVVGDAQFDGALYARDATGIGLRNAAGNVGVWVKDDGNVGIGTGDPQAKLHVKGDSWQNEGDESTIFLGDTHNYIKSIFGRGIQINTFYGDDGIFLQKEGGNVGIGVTNPDSRLQVAGTIHSTSGGFKFPDGSIQTSAATSNDCQGQFKITIDSKTEASEKYGENYALLIYNEETDDYGEDGIAIQLGTDRNSVGHYGKANHFLGFYDLEGEFVGAVQGFRTQEWVLDHGSNCGITTWSDLSGLMNPLQNNCAFETCELAEVGFDAKDAAAYAAQMICNNEGVVYCSRGGDYAEWLPKWNLMEEMASGDIVGLRGGYISKSTEDAERAMVISTGPVVLGNMPKEDEEYRFEPVAFLGQVLVKVVGPVSIGDYILPSGLDDGTGVAVPLDDMTAEDYTRVVGRAWSQWDYPGVKPVLCAVGLASNDWVPLVEKQQVLLDQQERRLEEQECLIDELLSRLDTLEERVNEISGVSGEKMSAVFHQGHETNQDTESR